jgi:uncharacterized protein YaiI (UPF0178 family)
MIGAKFCSSFFYKESFISEERGDLMKVIIDADAVPRKVLAICKKAAADFSIKLLTVASFNHLIESEHHFMVSDEPQAADIRVANLTEPGDLVVTQDWGLAALVLSKGAIVLTPKGRVFKNNEIAFLLEERDTMARIRRGGKRTRGPKKRKVIDDKRFEKNLYKWLHILEE